MAGRSTEYTADKVDQAAVYLETYEDLGDAIPSVAGLAVYLKNSRSSIYKWAGIEGNEAFADILGDILAKQEQVLINKGLTNTFNSAIVKLALGKHGYSDKSEQEVSGPGGGPVQTATAINFIPVTRDK
jgi:hypothetical protein